jgi:ABC-type lipopolysaccharide export system ATPase subunit
MSDELVIQIAEIIRTQRHSRLPDDIARAIIPIVAEACAEIAESKFLLTDEQFADADPEDRAVNNAGCDIATVIRQLKAKP